MGKLIVLEGTDGCGKSTQSDLLNARLAREGVDFRKLRFPQYDEPSSALDPIAEYEMFRNMMEACRNRTLIFISHRLSSAVLADRVIMLDGGRIAEAGTHEELMVKNGTYADMFRKQAENYADSLGDTESGVSGNA